MLPLLLTDKLPETTSTAAAASIMNVGTLSDAFPVPSFSRVPPCSTNELPGVAFRADAPRDQLKVPPACVHDAFTNVTWPSVQLTLQWVTT